MARKQSPPLAPSEVLAERLAALRSAREWSQADLADRMRSFGWSWDRTTVAKIEARSRQVALDEYIALAWVLGVGPAALITPLASTERMAVAPSQSVPVVNVWKWLNGVTVPTSFGRPRDLSRDEARAAIRFFEEAVPDYVVDAERELPGVRRLIQLLNALQTFAGGLAMKFIDAPDVDAQTVDQLLDEASALLRSIKERVEIRNRHAEGERE